MSAELMFSIEELKGIFGDRFRLACCGAYDFDGVDRKKVEEAVKAGKLRWTGSTPDAGFCDGNYWVEGEAQAYTFDFNLCLAYIQ